MAKASPGERSKPLIIYNWALCLSVLPTKYTTVSIPQTLHARLEALISGKTGFKSVSDYVTFVLREVVAMHETSHVPEAFTSSDIEEIKNRLKALGYL